MADESRRNARTLDAKPTTVFPGDHSRLDPPDPISNSEVKHTRADDSVGFPHVKVGHCQDFITEKRLLAAFFLVCFFIATMINLLAFE